MFGIVLTTGVTFMHFYVFWRAGTVPFLRRFFSARAIYGSGAVLWLLFYMGREYGHGGESLLATTLELLGMDWMAAIFLVTITFLVMDIITGFGFFLPELAKKLRGLALAAGILLSLLAVFQGMRAPVVREYEVRLAGLPSDMDGTVLVGISDTHIGSLIGKEWLEARVAQVNGQKPDIVVLLGDMIEGHGVERDEIIPVLKKLSAPLGVWAVTGNHDSYGRRNSVSLYEETGITLLSNSWAEIRPGFVLAGVDNLRSRSFTGQGDDPVSKALDNRPAGATVLLSHKPWQAERAAGAGAGLMLSGHTHGGQIWPFGYLVRRAYPLLAGRYEVQGMTVIVSRGTGTWGPRMRLWHPGEILRITLHGT